MTTATTPRILLEGKRRFHTFAKTRCNYLSRYRDCNIKIRVAFELDKTNGAVMFVNVPSRSKNDAEKNKSSKCCFGLTGNVTKSLGFGVESRNPNEHHFICELQLILKVAAVLLVFTWHVVTLVIPGFQRDHKNGRDVVQTLREAQRFTCCLTPVDGKQMIKNLLFAASCCVISADGDGNEICTSMDVNKIYTKCSIGLCSHQTYCDILKEWEMCWQQ